MPAPVGFRLEQITGWALRPLESAALSRRTPRRSSPYLSRYTHRVAISNRRLIALNQRSVTFKVEDYRIEGPGCYTTMTLDVGEFIRRFLSHVLPKGFHRIRHYGLFVSTNRTETMEVVGKLLDLAPSAAEQTSGTDPGQPLAPSCPHCGGPSLLKNFSISPGRS
jgi:hypothetical protein